MPLLLGCYVLIPADLEQGKVLGSLVYGTNVIGIHGAYDQVNRLCSEIAGKYGWGFVNVNLRPYYAEGSKTMGFEIVEQLGWQIPRHTVIPMASGSLLTKIHKAYQEMVKVGLVDESSYSVHGAQASGCSPISSVEGIRLLAEYAGIFAETAGGVTTAVAKKLIESGAISRDESAVLCITGHGLKTQEAIVGKCGEARLIAPNLREFEEKIYGPDITAAKP